MAQDKVRGSDSVRIQKGDAPGLVDNLNWKPVWKIEKYDEQGNLFESTQVDGNLLLNVGITRLLNLLIGNTANPYNSSNARIGVGDSDTPAEASQTELLGENKLFKAMDSGYPSVSGQTVSFRATFGGAEANFAWKEFGVDNGASAELLNRKVDDQGTKASGQTWVVTLEITLS